MNNAEQSQTSPQAIAIIGSGFSGSLVAANVVRQATAPLTITLIERKNEFAHGVAYGTAIRSHLLNVPAGKMSAFPDQPRHFLHWLHQSGYLDMTEATFAPRLVYGQYLQSILQEAEATASNGVKIQRISDEAIALETTPNCVKVHLGNGTQLTADRAVLAVGNFPAVLPAPLTTVDRHFVRDAWSAEAIADLDADAPVLLVGTGLTMVDAVVALQDKGHRGKIYAVSRHGLMPQVHQATKPYLLQIDVNAIPTTARALLQWVRQQLRNAIAEGYDWRAVIDALRPFTQQVWQALSKVEQKRFLRHVKAYWEVHRHRIAPDIAKRLDQAIAADQLIYCGGRIQTCQVEGDTVVVTLRERHAQVNTTLPVKRIINCTGANCDFRRLQHPLIASLQEQRLIRPNALSIGIDTAEDGALIDADGQVSQRLFTLGTPRKGNLWETTAVPELRVQAQTLAQTLLQPIAVAPASVSLPQPTLLFRQLYDRESCTYTYLVADVQTQEAILIDPVMDQVERDIQVLRELGLTLYACLETHVHADHVTGADKLRTLTQCQVIVPQNAGIIGADRTLADSELLCVGKIGIQAIATPGHTDHHLAYLVNGTHLLTGDALFIRGCGRADLQGGNAGALYDAVTQQLFTLPDDTLVYPGHDYQGRTVSTIGEEKRWNPRFAERSRIQFIELMATLNLPYPQKMKQAVLSNTQCGANGLSSSDEPTALLLPEITQSGNPYQYIGMYI